MLDAEEVTQVVDELLLTAEGLLEGGFLGMQFLILFKQLIEVHKIYDIIRGGTRVTN